MAWEIRPSGHQYYTRSRKVNGKVVREYVGTGLVGQMAADADELYRQEKQAQTDARKAEQTHWEAAVNPLRRLCRESQRLIQAALLGAGYHQHARGEWRRKHE